jgi:hypothetical protein
MALRLQSVCGELLICAENQQFATHRLFFGAALPIRRSRKGSRFRLQAPVACASLSRDFKMEIPVKTAIPVQMDPNGG